MIIDITEIIINRRQTIVALREWLDANVGPYLGPGQGLKRIDEQIPARYTTLEIGEGWQIEMKEIVDGYGRTVYYQLDIDNEQLATFFILKFL
jgi:hypothetical protein